MTSKADYGKVALEIAKHLNAFRLAFKTYNVAELDEMIKAVAGEGARVSTDTSSQEFQNALLERGFLIFPPIQESEDGYIRVIRANSIVGNLLNAFRYVGPSGDEELAKLLTQLKSRRRPDDLAADVISD